MNAQAVYDYWYNYHLGQAATAALSAERSMENCLFFAVLIAALVGTLWLTYAIRRGDELLAAAQVLSLFGGIAVLVLLSAAAYSRSDAQTARYFPAAWAAKKAQDKLHPSF